MGKTNKKKKKTVKREVALDVDDSTPRSFVFHRGEVGKTIAQLIADMRHVMEPYTATNLKVTKSNVLRDFVHVAGPYGISHFMMFSKTELAPYMKICRLPRGPTLTFKVEEYSLMKDIVSILRKPKTIGQQFRFPPLVVLNNFNVESVEMKLMTTVFQNMFPSIKVHKLKLADVRRCTMFNYNKDDNTIDFRHYNIEAVPVGISRGVKKLLKNKIPNLGSLNDIGDFVTGGAYLSESEGEEPTEAQVTLPQRLAGKGNVKSAKSAVKLTEMGPRLKLQLIKIEEGVSDGEVLYHQYVAKSKKEIKELRKKKEEAKKLKAQRRKEQELNIKKKEDAKEENKARSLAGMKRKQGDDGDNSDDDSDESKSENEEEVESDIDDKEYYKQEIGEDPDEELFDKVKPAKKFGNFNSKSPMKKRRLDGGGGGGGGKGYHNKTMDEKRNMKKFNKSDTRDKNEKTDKRKSNKNRLSTKVAKNRKFKPKMKGKRK